MTHEICAIVAMGDEFEIGFNGDLIWRIKEDLQRFRRFTMGHPIIMGRKTRDSLPKALPGRTNIVITGNPDYSAPDTLVAHSIEEALSLASKAEGADKIFIIGGGQIYRLAFPLLSSIEVTHIHDNPDQADTFFPSFTSADWELVQLSDPHRTPDGIEYSFESFRRISPDNTK